MGYVTKIRAEHDNFLIIKPNILLDAIDKSKYKSGLKDAEVQMEREREKKSLRADYNEFLELALLFLGGQTAEKKDQVIFHPPGATHHARWMSKALYSLKMFPFRNQLKLTESELHGIRAVNVFVIRFYLKLWFQSTKSYSAARLDLEFIQDMIRYIKEGPVLAKLILESIRVIYGTYQRKLLVSRFLMKTFLWPLNEKW